MTEREVMAELVRFVGVLTYGKERWFKQNGCWYDRMFGDCIQNEVLLERITEAINDEIEDRPTGEWVRKYDKRINCYWYECNQCGECRPRNVFGKEWSSPYCPNCGAKMGGDTK